MKPTWLSDIVKWNNMDIISQLKELKKFYCTGPCGQSNDILETRIVTQKALENAIKQIEALREYGKQ